MLDVTRTNAFLHVFGVEKPSNHFMDQSILILPALMQKPLKARSVLFFNRGLGRAVCSPGSGQQGIALAKICPGPLQRSEFFCLRGLYQALENCLQPLTFCILLACL